MKIQFKHKDYQVAAVDAVVDCFAGQPKVEGVSYRLDPGKQVTGQPQSEMDYATEAFRNVPIVLDDGQLLENIQKVQRSQNLPQSTSLTDFTVIDSKKNKRACGRRSKSGIFAGAKVNRLQREMAEDRGPC